MIQRLPPLNAVRAFVAAARHLSFTQAAAELHVTHGAVSRQVRHLEDHLGVRLFDRQVRQVSLTARGQAFYAQAEAALAQIAMAAEALRTNAVSSLVRINVRPSFAVRWLIPRLPDFVARHPGIEPEVVTSTALPAAAPGSYDVAIRRGPRGWPSTLIVKPWLEDEAMVVGAPSLLRDKSMRIIAPADLGRHQWLAARSRNGDWDAWLRCNDLVRIKPASRLHLDHLHLVLQAAVDGLGLAMAPRSLLANDLRQRRLLAPLPGCRLPLERYYYGFAEDARPEVHHFLNWLDALPSAGRRSRR